MRFRRLMLPAGLALLVTAILLAADRRIPTGPDSWGAGHQDLVSGVRELRVATFNIHGCKGSDGIRSVDRIADLVRDLDIVGLNEVHGAVWSAPQNQTTHLAELCRIPSSQCVFAPAETRWFGGKQFGNGLLTRQPLLKWQRIPLPRRYDRSCRNILMAEIAGPNGRITVLVTHIARSNDRERQIQLETVLNLFTKLDPPAILLADLNTPPDAVRMDRFLAENRVVDAIAEGGNSGSNRVDWILVRGLDCLGSTRIDTEASDHPLFTAVLSFPTPSDSLAD